MVRDMVKPDFLTLASCLKACTSVLALEEGKEIHSFICATQMDKNKFLSSTLIDMYGKCGNLTDAQNGFSNSQERDVAVWNSMIAVLIAQECCEEALLLFGKMGGMEVDWDDATLVNVLKSSTECKKGTSSLGMLWFRDMCSLIAVRKHLV
ncbi:hypothetical protein GOP47_0028667 [Adiantum capillus-veneris]|nr:hypothetical protein GOP47_0028667 [Adiantum capillus-veneris]